MSVIGQNVDLTYPYNYLGEGAADLGEALKDEEFMKGFKEAKFPVVLVGPGILHRGDRDTILQQVSTLLQPSASHRVFRACSKCKAEIISSALAVSSVGSLQNHGKCFPAL